MSVRDVAGHARVVVDLVRDIVRIVRLRREAPTIRIDELGVGAAARAAREDADRKARERWPR